jgi:trehalose 6-phosphate synthase
VADSESESTFDLVVAANRLPVNHVVDAFGATTWARSLGGLVTAMEPVMKGRDAAWIGWAGDPGPTPEPFRQAGLHLRPVSLSDTQIHEYSEGFSNDTLWPIYHDVIVQASFHRNWWNTYRTVNHRFAQAICQAAAPGATVWVHDYQLQLVPAMVRALRPDVRIGWFNHIPFPPFELFAQLPWRQALVEGLLGADFLGFQRAEDADNFLRVCARLLHMATTEDTVTFTPPGQETSVSRTVRASGVPISVDYQGLEALARSPEVVARAAQIRSSLGDPKILMLGVDRLDYTKGIRHRLKAYEELLQDKAIAPPDVALMMVTLPSRERAEAYRQLRGEVEGTVGRINGEHSALGCAPVQYLYHAYPRAEMVAMFLAADVMLVTPLRDGMNLVAKEYVACRYDLGGALVLSEFAGAWHELHEAFSCNPHDIEGLKQTIMCAITATDDERRLRMRALREGVAANDVQAWARLYLDSLAAAPARPQQGDQHHLSRADISGATPEAASPEPEKDSWARAASAPTLRTSRQRGLAVPRDGPGPGPTSR